MSIYVLKDGKKVRVCRYECQTVIQWDNKNNYFVEPEHDNVQHTPERCKAFKEINQDPNKQQAVNTLKQIANVTNNAAHTTVTLEQVQRKLESIGIIINVERLMNQ